MRNKISTHSAMQLCLRKINTALQIILQLLKRNLSLRLKIGNLASTYLLNYLIESLPILYSKIKLTNISNYDAKHI